MSFSLELQISPKDTQKHIEMPTKTTSKAATNEEPALSKDDVKSIDELRKAYDDIKSELSKIIIGQEEAIERMFLCMLSQGHALLMGVPGLAKTLLVNSISQTTNQQQTPCVHSISILKSIH